MDPNLSNLPDYDAKIEPKYTAEQSEILDRDLYRGIPGIIKLLQVLFALIAYIIMEATRETNSCEEGFRPTYGFFKFVCLVGFVSALIVWVLLLVQIPSRLCTGTSCCRFCYWAFIQLVYLSVLVFLFLIINIVLAVQTCNLSPRKAAVAFGFFAMFAFIADLVFAFKLWWNKRQELKSQSGDNPEAPKY